MYTYVQYIYYYILMDLIISHKHVFLSTVTHSMKFFYTGVTAVKDFPEYTAVGTVDDQQFVYYDSNIKRMIPKTEWIKQNEGTDYWDRESQKQIGTQPVFKSNIGTAMQRFNQTQGVHVAQSMYGCEWDEETGATDGFFGDGYDGEDFIALDLKNMQWVAPMPQAVQTKQKWNNNPAQLENWKNYLTQECIEWLKKYVSYGRSTLERRGLEFDTCGLQLPPEVSVFQKDSSSPVVCHATGFFPRGIMVTWQRDGEEVHEDVELGETLPNGDGTFQITSRLTVKPEDWKSHNYNCTVQHKSLEKDIVMTRSPDSSGPPMGIIIGCVVGALIVALAVIGVIIQQRAQQHCTALTVSVFVFLSARLVSVRDFPVQTASVPNNITQPCSALLTQEREREST
ncbi:hypothetical protein JZ751_026109 [Albula glossodonta]|uniref:Ig-like domain-containing protein n=1 Tax=Albula glossodonta TaxID=121402 RepID=A0A8T2MXK1_9TELE|nr:hypothetical protein JZ751_026109 [Albula glossodonta]